ncbi:MAG: hypothetical protein MPK08_04620, partial [Alphaproteobacteria bacterium]|nr:hypothetical protein [Alphaproteobacteria bacterium]
SAFSFSYFRIFSKCFARNIRHSRQTKKTHFFNVSRETLTPPPIVSRETLDGQPRRPLPSRPADQKTRLFNVSREPQVAKH